MAESKKRASGQAGNRTTTPPAIEVAVIEQEEIAEGIICVDNGGKNTKVLTEDMDTPVVLDSKKAFGHSNFKSVNNHFPEGTYKIKWQGKYYFFGLMMLQTRNVMTSYTASKSTDYFILSVLQSVALYGYKINYLMTTTPFSRYSEDEQNAINDRLIGDHELEINNVVYTFTIADSIVAPECLIASNANKLEGIVRWLDLGSRTVGYASTIGQAATEYFQPLEGYNVCGTIEKEGLEIRDVLEREGDALKAYLEEYVENIYNHLSPIWEDDDKVVAFGGGALVPELIEELQKRYPNLIVDEDPLTMQVRGMMEVALDEKQDVFGLFESSDVENDEN
ncbi:hypothetical protein BSK59_15580 [Paenibacillus odorifer]|uniref:ParM/StbA family protein n=1 Tax=Paenibacillus odorifer TaxID=189426 RepID=UPI00096FC434|nr:hypothetical protein [Paenibacillus odorifer]OME54000.1 hypothetical protein BSK59_15580 [Paenibacillus odorifer]